MQRFEVHCHSDYSNLRILDSISKVKDIVQRAIDNGLSGLALTDHETLSNAVVFSKAIKKIQEKYPEFKGAIGNEIYLCKDREKSQKYYHFILIAKNKQGYRALRELSSRAWLNSYYDRGMERVVTTYQDLEEIIHKYPNSLIASTACLASQIDTYVLTICKTRSEEEKTQAIQDLTNFIQWCLGLFGEDFYLECAPSQAPEQIIVNKFLNSYSQQTGIKLVLGTDAHYLKKEDRFVHKAFLTSKEGEREVDEFYSYSYLQTEEEIKENIAVSELDYNTLIANSYEIYNKIENYSIFRNQTIPKVEVKEYPAVQAKEFSAYPILQSMFQSKDNVERYWINQCVEKLHDLNINLTEHPEYLERLEEEADTKRTVSNVLGNNMFQYPITLQYYIDMFWEMGSLVGAGRGSACSGLNHYLLGITQLDPIIEDLPWWRYMNRETRELGDIDIDICPSKRPAIIQKIKEDRAQKFNQDIDELSKANLGCTLIATFGTMSAKSAILCACRGYRSDDYSDGIDSDTAQFISSLIPQERGQLWTLEDALFGNPEKGRRPVAELVKQIKLYPGLQEILLGIQGMISQRGSHASGVIFFDEDPYELGAFMRTPSGEVITQWDLHDAESLGMTKFDILVTDIQDKLAETIKLLQKNNEIEPELTLRQVYEKYFHPSVLPIKEEKYWKEIQKNNVLNFFQFDSLVGGQAIKRVQPASMQELTDVNGLMRLMADDGAELPLDKYVKFKNNINLWYQEMDEAGLTPEEEKALEPHFLESFGVPPSQEQLMTMLMDENICGFTLAEANDARRVVSKKKMDKIPELKDKILSKAKSAVLGDYVWHCGLGPQMGYSFSKIHAKSYSYIGFQSVYIATRWNPIYWNTACLIVNSGSLEEPTEEDKKNASTNYSKLAKAIGDIRSAGIQVSLVNINTSEFGFSPDVKNNRILFGLKGMLNVGDDVVNAIIDNRPYLSIKDFYYRVKPNKQAMIALIKGGAFDELEERKFAMAWYIWETCDKKKRITLQNMAGLTKYNLLPTETEEQQIAYRVYEFNRYLKAVCKYNSTHYKLDERSLNFLSQIEVDELIEIANNVYLLNIKSWDKIYQKWMDIFRYWMAENQNAILSNLNTEIFLEDWNNYAKGTYSTWEMEVLCFYYHEHELAHLNPFIYGIRDFQELPEEPKIERSFTKGGKTINMFELSKICGTCIAKDKTKAVVTILTTSGVVNVKFRKEYFSLFDQQISAMGADNKKHIVERSWFNRGSMIVVNGMRSGDDFIAKKYASAGANEHTLYKITSIDDAGHLVLQTERHKGEMEEDEL